MLAYSRTQILLTKNKTNHLLSQVWWSGSAAADIPRVSKHLCSAAENLQEAEA